MIEVEARNGKTLYEATIDKGETATMVIIAESGKVLAREKVDEDEAREVEPSWEKASGEKPVREKVGKEKEITLDEAPAAVRLAVKAKLAGGDMKKFTRTSGEEGATFKAEFAADGDERTIKFSQGGELLEEVRKMEPLALPRGIAAAIREREPGAKIVAAEAVTVTFYRVRITGENVGKREVRVSPAGKLLKGAENEGE